MCFCFTILFFVIYDRKIHNDLFFLQINVFHVDQSEASDSKWDFRWEQAKWEWDQDLWFYRAGRLRFIVDYFEPAPLLERIICPSPFPGGIWGILLLWPKSNGLPLSSCPLRPASPRTCLPQSETQLHHPCGPALTTAPSSSHFPAHWSRGWKIRKYPAQKAFPA